MSKTGNSLTLCEVFEREIAQQKMPTDSDLRQAAVDVLCKELKKARPSKSKSEIALAVLTEMREAIEDSPKYHLQEFVKELLIQTAVELELERKLHKGGLDVE